MCLLKLLNLQALVIVLSTNICYAKSSSRAVHREVLQPLEYCDHGFESLSGHECSSALFVVCFIGSGLYDGIMT